MQVGLLIGVHGHVFPPTPSVKHPFFANSHASVRLGFVPTSMDLKKSHDMRDAIFKCREWLRWKVFLSDLWDVMAEAVLPVAVHAELSESEHGSFTLDKAAHAVGLLDGADEGVKVVLCSSGCSNVAGTHLHFFTWNTNAHVGVLQRQSVSLNL